MSDGLILLMGLLLCGWMLFAVVFDDTIKRRI
ncbi:hypothetical protein M467_05210 [Exiguobacterium chiriqhucha RW-2]|jgi:hypothetical protein|uniref:Uncharacterized protein n=1 Tax=Exiguobacterium chiriqhucha RW-2 TaxID=1345023 RepID=U1LVN3_9BACL|nr:hypothetical protein M467_05210 [Exiguobacterium chiriqhucha RW-2]